MKLKIALTVLLALLMASNASASVNFGDIKVNDSYISPGDTVKISVDVTTPELNEGIVGVDAKWNSDMSWNEYGQCDGDGSCSASWTFTPSTTGERTIYVRALSDSMRSYDQTSKQINVYEELKADFHYSPQKPEPGRTVTLDASCRTGSPCVSGGVETYMWDLDGNKIYDDADGFTTQKSFNSDTEVGLRIMGVSGEFKTKRKTIDVDEDISLSTTLIEPQDEEGDVEGLSVTPDFVFQGSYGAADGNEELTYVLKLEKGRDADPFSSPDRRKSVTRPDDSRPSVQFSNDLKHDKWYTWGITVKYDGKTKDSVTRSFKTSPDQEQLKADFHYSPSSPEPGETVTFDASCGTGSPCVSGDIQAYMWNFDEDDSYDDGEGFRIQHSFNSDTEVGLRVMGASGNFDSENKTIDVNEPEKSLSATLIEPLDGKTGLGLRPQFIFQGSYGAADGNEEVTYVLKVEEEKGDNPFTDPDRTRTITRSDGQRPSITLNSDLNKDSWYTWGITVKYDGKSHNSNTRTFKTRSEGLKADFHYSPSSPEPGETVTFDASCGTGSPCVSGSIDEYMWDFDEDEIYDDGDGFRVTRSFNSDAEVSLRVKSTSGNFATERKQINVQEPETQLSAKPIEPLDGKTGLGLRPQFIFQGSYGAADGNQDVTYVLKLEKEKNDNPFTDTDRSKSVTNPDDQRPSLRFDSDLQPGSWYTWGITVKYDGRSFNSDMRTFKTRDRTEGDNRPTARFDWNKHPIVAGERVTFDASDSYDPDNDIKKYRWDFEGSSGYDYGVTEDHVFGSPGTYNVELRVKDSKGNTHKISPEMTVVDQPGSCSVNVDVLRFGDSVIERGDSTQTSVRVYNNGDAQDYKVVFTVGQEKVETIDREVSAGSSSKFSATVSPSRDRVVTAEVKTQGEPCGDREYTRSAMLRILATDDDDGGDEGPEKPRAWFKWSPSQPHPGDKVTFDASGSNDEDGDVEKYKWFFGDGTSTAFSKSNKKITHSYSSTGGYPVQLVIKDSDGKKDAVTRTVPVVTDPKACSVQVSSIRFGDNVIERGESTSTSITVSNLGESQTFKVRFKVGLNTVETREIQIDANSQTTISTSISPDRDEVVSAKVSTDRRPCGNKAWNRYRKIIVLANSDTDIATLDVNVRSEDGRRLSNARVHVDGPQSVTRFTGSRGDTVMDLESGTYDLRVSRQGYSTEYGTVELSEGEDRGLTIVLERSEESNFVALVEDSEGNRLSNARIRVENGVTKTRYTNSNGRALINLNQGTYTVTARKDGYGQRTKTVEIDSNEETTEVFTLYESDQEGLNIQSVSYPSSVCRGSTMNVDVEIANNAGFHELVTLTGKGLGSINMVDSFSLDEEGTVTKTIRFTNVQGTRSEEFTVTVNNHDSDSKTRTVTVKSCTLQQQGKASDISMQIDYPVTPQMAVYGDYVKVSGFVDGARGRSQVTIKMDGQTKASINTQPDGYYQTWITASPVGPHTVTATTGEVKDSAPLRVIPTSTVTNVQAPMSVFNGQTFEICANVQSQITPRVILERDGKVVQTKEAKGEVCFQRTATEPGTHKYRVAALTSGNSNSASTNVEVLKMGVEASSFPDQIASVESGSGMVKVDLYNTNENVTRYNLDLEGLPQTWIAQSEKQVILQKGERKTVYFYLTPQEEGSYRPTITVTADGNQVYREKLNVITGGTTESRPESGIIGSIVNAFTGLFTF